MSIDRRDFLKTSAAGTIGLMSHLGSDHASAAQQGVVKLEVRIEGLGGLVLDGKGPDIPLTLPGAQSVFINNTITDLAHPRHNPEAKLVVADMLPPPDGKTDWVKILQEVKRKNDLQLRSLPRSLEWEKKVLGANYADTDRTVAISIRDFDVSFEKAMEPRLTLSQADLPEQECPPPADDAGWASLHHLASLVRICGHGTIGTACLDSTPPRSVSARVSMQGGTLACAMPLNRSYAEKIWKFEKDKKVIVKQRVADAVIYRATAPPPASPTDPAFTMVLTPFKGVPGAGDAIRIGLKGAAGSTISLTLTNVPTRPVFETDHVDHFRVYYDLLSVATYDRLTPHVALDCKQSEALPTDSEPNYCPSGLYFTGKAGNY